MSIKNDALKRMLEKAEAAKKNQGKKSSFEPAPTTGKRIALVEAERAEEEERQANLPASLNLSLAFDEPVTKEMVMANVALTERALKGTASQYEKAKRHVGRLTTGAAAATPLVCRGSDCPFKARCIYFQENIHEVGKNCLEEEQLIQFWTQKYMDEFQVDYDAISEIHTISRIVEITILDLRMTKYIAINDQDLMMDFISSVDPNGTALTNKGASVAFDLKERLEKTKTKLLESLNGTRERKAKLALQVSDQEIQVMKKAQLFDKLDHLAAKYHMRGGSSKTSVIIDVTD